MHLPRAAFALMKEAARHILRRPVVGVAAYARTPEGLTVLIRRADTGEWALPGGTLEWGETLRDSIVRELLEEAGVEVLSLGGLLGAYSDPRRDLRLHAVSIIVAATVAPPSRPPANPLEILEVRLFGDEELPRLPAHGMTDMLRRAQGGIPYWE